MRRKVDQVEYGQIEKAEEQGETIGKKKKLALNGFTKS